MPLEADRKTQADWHSFVASPTHSTEPRTKRAVLSRTPTWPSSNPPRRDRASAPEHHTTAAPSHPQHQAIPSTEPRTKRAVLLRTPTWPSSNPPRLHPGTQPALSTRTRNEKLGAPAGRAPNSGLTNRSNPRCCQANSVHSPLRKTKRDAHYHSVESSLNSALHDRKRSPGTYLLTFACYGAKLHGDAGTVDRWHNVLGSPRIQENARRVAHQRQLMDQPPYTLDGIRRSVTLKAIQEVCDKKSWTLLAAHVRTTHVHVVVESEASAEWVMSTLKRAASRSLNELGVDGQAERRRWARHGSTRYIWTKEQLSAAIRYTVSGQGEQLSVYEAP